MRGAVMHAHGDVRFEDRPDPVIQAPTDAVIRRSPNTTPSTRSTFPDWATAPERRPATTKPPWRGTCTR